MGVRGGLPAPHVEELADRGAADVAVMRAIKRALDPDNIMNPGKVVTP